MTLSIAGGPAGETLGDMTFVAAQDGIATFNGLTFSEPGTYTLVAHNEASPSVTSTSFDVTLPALAASLTTGDVSQTVETTPLQTREKLTLTAGDEPVEGDRNRRRPALRQTAAPLTASSLSRQWRKS